MSGTKNKIVDLRNHLFETLEWLKDPDKPMEIERAQAIANIAREIIQSAKVEVDFLRVTGGMTGSGFIPSDLEFPAKRPVSSPEPGLARRKMA